MKFNKPKIAKCIDKKIADCMIDNEFSNGIFNEKIDENTFVVDGQISIYDFEKLVGVKDIETECDTLSGYLMELMDRVPTEEENPVIETDKLVFKIEEFDERRIAKVKVCKINVSKKENDEDEE